MVDKTLYDEVCELFSNAGGVYQTIKPEFYDYLLECLDLGQYFAVWDEGGKLVSFGMYWWIDQSEQHVALKYERPCVIVGGSSVWVVDFVNHIGRHGIRLFAEHLRHVAPPGSSGIAWDHRNSRKLANFPRQKGHHHEN